MIKTQERTVISNKDNVRVEMTEKTVHQTSLETADPVVLHQ